MRKNGKNIKCKVCKTEFYISGSRFGVRKYCSTECARKDDYGFKPKSKKCANCAGVFTIKESIRSGDKTCSTKCRGEMVRRRAEEQTVRKKTTVVKRRGKNNPAYRNGKAMQGKRTYTGIHLRACSKYRKALIEKHGYQFCESCKVNQNGTPKFEVHHIYFASLYPKHKQLHNTKNLINLCIRCHNDFHSSKRKEEFAQLEKDRGLKELFKK